jgi:hypothetical protein
MGKMSVMVRKPLYFPMCGSACFPQRRNMRNLVRMQLNIMIP